MLFVSARAWDAQKDMNAHELLTQISFVSYRGMNSVCPFKNEPCYSLANHRISVAHR